MKTRNKTKNIAENIINKYGKWKDWKRHSFGFYLIVFVTAVVLVAVAVLEVVLVVFVSAIFIFLLKFLPRIYRASVPLLHGYAF